MSKAIMARGWESKAVEDQIEEAALENDAHAKPVTPSAETGENKYKRDALRLTRSRLNEQLQNARSVSHRQMLHQALRAIDQEIAALEPQS